MSKSFGYKSARKTSSQSKGNPSIEDPTVHRCIVAALRIIAKSHMTSASMPSEIASFLAALATPSELLASFAKARKRKVIEKALLSPDADVEIVIDDGDVPIWLLQNGQSFSVGPLIAPPPEDVSRACQRAEPKILQHIVETLLRRIDQPSETPSIKASGDWLGANTGILAALFGFTVAEASIVTLSLSLANIKGRSDVVSECVNELFYCRSERKQSVAKLAFATGHSEKDVSVVFEAGSALRGSGLFENIVHKGYDLDDALRLSGLGQLFASEQFESQQTVRDRVLTPISTAGGESLVFTHLEKQRMDITALLNGAMASGESGVNVLLYGKPGTGKTEFAKMIAKQLAVNCYEVGYAADGTGLDATRDDRLNYLKLANRLIKAEERAIILLDEAEDIFDSISTEPMRGASRRRVGKAWMNALLEGIRIPTVWITNDVCFDPAHLRRFAYLAEFEIPPVGVRRQIVQSHAAGLAVSEKTISTLARNDALSPAMLGAATRFVRLARFSDAEVDEALLRHTQSTQSALGVEPSGTVVDSETKFDPRYINLDSPISVEALCAALKRTGCATLLLSGPPGTGKTQLANYLVEQLGRELVYRTGSDLLNKYVGETEQRIARLFKSCDPEREVIFLDEAEGLLANRDGAQRRWEVTQVNEFLRQIEQFKGIFIAATNHFANLDPALMRRFAFRLGFKPLTLEKRVLLFEQVSGHVVTPRTPEFDTLRRLDQLAAGDFANVARRFRMLAIDCPLAEWLSGLEEEMDAKPSNGTHPIGFSYH